MIQKEINRLTAASTTVAFCETPASLAATASIANFPPTVALAKSKIVIIQGYNILADAPIKGVTLDVNALRTSMIQHTLMLASAVSARGASLTPPDFDLMARAKVSKSYLEDIAKEKCSTECSRIHELALLNAADIAPFGVSAADISDAQNLINLFMNAISHPRAAVISRSSAVRQASLHLRELVNNILTLRLDKMANVLRYKNTQWWNQYRMSREKVDVGIRHTKFQLTVFNQNRTAVKGALVSFLQNNKASYNKKTDEHGRVSMARIKPGYYDLKIEKPGFTPQTESEIHFAPGKEVSRDITLSS